MVHGRFEGSIRVERRVTVAEDGEVEGEIHSREIIIAGRVKGDVFASDRAELAGSAAVEGKVQAPKIVIAEGARLQGSVAMAPETAAGPAGAAPARKL